MKVILVLETNRLAGGGFNQALNAILQMQKLSRNNFEFSVITNLEENVEYLTNLGIQSNIFKYTLLDRLFPVLKSNWITGWLVTRLNLLSSFERKLKQLGADLVYFVMPSATSNKLQTLNYISTVWDLCHRDFPEFPEVRNFGVFQEREALYTGTLGSSILIITESEQGAIAAVRRYGIDRDRILAMPLSLSPYISTSKSLELDMVMSKYNISPGYYFYPAQLWAHKNHIRILEAIAQLKEQGIIKQVVFAGGDKGLGVHMNQYVTALQLENQVNILGFVPNEYMRGLYEGCAAVVMPTYFGPTNIPPLEAWSIGRPLIYSSHLSEQTGDAALLVDPDDVHSLVLAMKDVLDPSIAESLVTKGFHRLTQIEENRRESENELLHKLQTFEKRLLCWR